MRVIIHGRAMGPGETAIAAAAIAAAWGLGWVLGVVIMGGGL